MVEFSTKLDDFSATLSELGQRRGNFPVLRHQALLWDTSVICVGQKKD